MKLIEKKSIKIGDKEYPIKLTIRSMMEFERITGHSVSEINSLEDMVALFYCTVKAGGENITYDQFLDLIDDNFESITAFSEAVGGKVEKKQKPI